MTLVKKFFAIAPRPYTQLLLAARTLTLSRLSLCIPSRYFTGGSEHADSDFFHYTSGRWLDKELDAAEQKMRYLAFDVNALKAAAVAAVDGAQSVVNIVKLPEGSYSKTFLMTLDNKEEVIARLRTPYAPPPHYATASEVATMEFARVRLGLPVPRVLSWCSAKGSTAVGAEFIIMEKAIGVPVSKLWPQMSQLQKLKFVEEVVKVEKAALGNPLPSYGSIFFRGDIAPEKAFEVDDIFVIGPTVEWKFWGGERIEMNLDRGPCECLPLSLYSLVYFLRGKTPSAYLHALCQREQEWIRSYASSQPLHQFRDHPAITRDPSAHLGILDHFRSIIPSILPIGSPELVQPTLWHRDLSGDNIFISEEELAKGRVSITSITDWKHMWAGPMYLQACVPRVFRYHSPWNVPERLQIASLPEGISEKSESEQKAARDDVDAKNLEICYRAHVVQHAPLYYGTLVEGYFKLFADLHLVASMSWDMFHIVSVHPVVILI